MAAQPRARPDLAAIMRGPELVGRAPEQVRWTADGAWIHFEWLEPGAAWDEPLRPFRVRPRAGARPEQLSPALADSLQPLLASGPRSPDGRWRAVEALGDLWLVARNGSAVRRLTHTAAPERGPHWSSDGRRVYFERGGNAWAVVVRTGLEVQLTDLRAAAAPASDTAEGQRRALERTQQALLGAVRDRTRRDSVAAAAREAAARRRVPPTVWLGEKADVDRLLVSPDGSTVLVLSSSAASAARRTEVPQWVTRSGYVTHELARPKVGDHRASRRAGLLRLAGDTVVHWLDVTGGDSLAPSSLRSLGWQPGGAQVALVSVSADHTTRRLLLAAPDGDSPAVRPIDVQVDPAWVGGPCSSCAGWYPDGSAVWMVAEVDGWAHLHRITPTGDRRALTQGTWEVRSASLDDDGRAFLLGTSASSPYETHLHLLPAGGGRPQRLTAPPGLHAGVRSPDGGRLALVSSASNQPPELFVQASVEAEPVRLTTSPSAAFQQAAWIIPEIVDIPASDGARVPARIYRPADLGATPNGAAVIFVHGAGYLQNVHHGWSGYAREYMFHHLLAARGYVVLDLDYRGSAGHGRDWRTAIHGHMGGRDLADHVDASHWLEQRLGIPPERIGIYGGSYGGFIALMALFRAPERFGAGAALRPVTDWSHYNNGYTARILGLPQSDTLAYRRSSPIWFAEGLADPLLIAHGMVDDNVHFQDVVRLAQRLIELGKDDWELAVYPVEGHGFMRPDSWRDEYHRILALFERHLHD